MIRCLTLTTLLLFLLVTGASAQRRQAIIPGVAVPPGISAALFEKKLRHMLHTVYNNPTGAMQKTTAGNERLFAEADYDYLQSPGSQLVDSLRLVYSGNRSSVFDFDNLIYDYDNYIDLPTSFGMGGYVQFDTLRRYDPPGSAFYTPAGIRTYDAAGKVLRDENRNYANIFLYNAQGRVVKTTAMSYDAFSMTWDSSYRDLYSYNASGYLISDSSEDWDAMSGTWQPGSTTMLTLNAAGYPTQISFVLYFGPVPVPFFQGTIDYNAANKPIRYIFMIHNGTRYENSSKDTFAYTGSMQVFRNIYEWDTTALAWRLAYLERRHLNATSLPDSIWSRSDTNGVPQYTTIQKLAYNAQGNPVYLRYYESSTTTPDYEQRWYYETIGGVGIGGIPAKNDLLVFPNPAADVLYIKGAWEGPYAIYNVAGQVLQSGNLASASAGVPVHLLAPGSYTISLHDKAGAMHTAQFIRQ